MSYVLDLMLFLGRKILNPKETSSEGKEKIVRYGRVPSILLETTSDQIQSILKNDLEIQALQKSALNAYKLYFKIRNQPSRSSMKRIKHFDTETPHHLLRSFVDENEEFRQDFLNKLKTFRPQSTVFEQAESTEEVMSVMDKKRRSHNPAIEKKKVLLIEIG